MIPLPASVVRRAAALALVGVVAVAPAADADPGDPINLGGTPVEAGNNPKSPTKLEAGLWSTTLAAGDSVRQQFSYERTEDYSTVHVSVTAAPKSSDESVKVEAFLPDGTSCGSESASADYSAPFTAIGVDLVIGPDDAADLNGDCLRATRLRFEVGPSGSTRTSETDLPMTVKIVEESPLKHPDSAEKSLPPAPETPPTFVPPADGDERGTTQGALSFDDAPLLESGTYSSSVTEGEQRLYRVHLEWGQTLAARLDVDAWGEKELEVFGYTGPTVNLGVYNPMRRDLDASSEDLTSYGSVSEEALELSNGLGPVRFLNRYADLNNYLPGDYYVSVLVPAPDSRKPETIPFTLTVEAQGEVDGVPAYARAEPFLIGNGKRSAAASGNPAPPDDEADWLDTRHLSGVGLGVFGLLCLGLGTVLLRRRPA